MGIRTKKDERKLRKLKESGHFVDPGELEPAPKPKFDVREIDGCTFPVQNGMRNYFWPFLAWLRLRNLKSNISYVSFLERMERDEGLFFGLEAYAVWRADRGPILLGWVEHRNVADALAEIGHLEEMRTRLRGRLAKLGAPHDALEIGLAVASPALEFEEIAEYVEVEEASFIGKSEMPELGRRLDELVEAMPRHVGPVEQVLAATGVMFDHTFPSQPLTALPSEFFDPVDEARAA